MFDGNSERFSILHEPFAWHELRLVKIEVYEALSCSCK